MRASGRGMGAVVAVGWGGLAVAMLAGCAGAASVAGASTAAIADRAHTVDASLLQTKSSAQLLRNESLERLPSVIFKEVESTEDVSQPCLDAKDDPDGTARSWRSAATVVVTNSQAPRVDTVTQDVIASFGEQGWTGAGDVESTVVLTRPTSTSTVEITAHPKAGGEHATVEIAVVGPCVMTGGADSDEVKHLEGRD